MGDLELQAILRYEGKLVEVIACTGFQNSWTLRPVNAEPCPHCGSLGDIHVIEDSLLFRQNAEPVKTLRRQQPSGEDG